MAYSLVQTIKNDGDAGINHGTTETGNSASPITAGNTLVAFLFYGGAPSSIDLADAAGTNDVWTQCGSTLDYSATYHVRMYRLENAAAGTLNLRATFNGEDGSDPAIVVYEFSGLSTTGFDKTTGQHQTNPGTGTDAITSGNTSTLASQPQMVIAFCSGGSTLGTQVAGTGFTGATPIWYYGGSAYTSVMAHKRVTATTAVAGTFTDSSNGSGQEYTTFVATFAESGGGGDSTITPTQGTVALTGNSSPMDYRITPKMARTWQPFGRLLVPA